MDNEILEILKSMQSDMKIMQSDIKDLKQGQNETNTKLTNIDKILDAIYDHRAKLTEFRTESRDVFKSIKEDLSNLELITAKNNLDIVKLEAVR